MKTPKTCVVEGCDALALARRARCPEHERRWRSASERGVVARPQALVGLALDACAETLESTTATRSERLAAAAVLPDLLRLDNELR